MTKRIGFIGLGRMGRWLAGHLLKGGVTLGVYDVDPDAVNRLAGDGALPSGSPMELAQRSDLIFLSLPDPNVVESVVSGENGIVHGARDGLTIVDCGTSDFRWTRTFSESLRQQGIRFVDAPVTGAEERAKAGTLTIMFGGGESLFNALLPLLQSMGRVVVRMGDVGSGQLAKMINNILYDANIAALAEVLPMAAKLGLDPESMGRVINAGSAGSFASNMFIDNILHGVFDRHYPLAHAYKDLESAMKIAEQENIPLPMIRAARQTYEQALDAGLGREDKGAMIKVFEKSAGVEFRSNRQGNL